mmetsp:Transcript_26799/g.63749  ORF Transcript_26799/g.63749 Transcript_26799/m.63749 type:complete len:255 (+) Transcript_26799:3-767(+)
MSESGDSDVAGFDAGLFVDKEYQDLTFSFGAHQVVLKALKGSTTEWDLTGQIIWPAASLLCDYILEHKTDFIGRHVLEVGAGCGLSGIFTAKFAKEVVLTDYQEVVLEVLAQNCEASNVDCAGEVRCAKLEWGKELEPFRAKHAPEGFDVIIGADVVHWPDCIRPLIDSLEVRPVHLGLTTRQTLLSSAPSASCVIAYIARSERTQRDFMSALSDSNFVWDEVDLSAKRAADAADPTVHAAGAPHIVILRRRTP